MKGKEPHVSFSLSSAIPYIILVLVIAIITVLIIFCSKPNSVKKTTIDPESLNQIASIDNDDAIEVIAPEKVNSPQTSFNTLLRWGIVRKPDNQVPGTDPGTPEILKKYQSLYIGNPDKKVVYLTFDEGYEAGYTAKILDVLKEKDAKAAFFITGHYFNTEKSLVKRMLDEGHTVGNHTLNHKCLPMLQESEIETEVMGLDKMFFNEFGVHMTFIRPPKGEYSQKSLEITYKYGLKNVFWSFAYDDWYRDKVRGADYARDIVMRNLHNGEIMLLHAVSQDNAAALSEIITDIRQKGYELGRLEDITS